MPVTPRRPSPLNAPAPKASPMLDRITATPTPPSWRVRSKPTFNSAV